MNCGALCLRYIHTEHGKQISLRRSRELCKTTRNGTSIPNLVNALESLGYRNVRVKQNLTWTQLKRLVDSGNDVIVSWISDLPAGNVPAFAEGHYSVARKLTCDAIDLFDPDADQIIRLPKAYFLARFYDFAIDRAGKRTDFLQTAVVARYPRKK